MTAPHTIRHAIGYLQIAAGDDMPPFQAVALRLADPRKPCAAYGLAKRTFLRVGSLQKAIQYLQKELEPS